MIPFIYINRHLNRNIQDMCFCSYLALNLSILLSVKKNKYECFSTGEGKSKYISETNDLTSLSMIEYIKIYILCYYALSCAYLLVIF